MRISVVTPSFNQGEFLGECLASVHAQTHRAIEHFVYDPGSTDGSRAIAEAAPGVTLVAEPDRGQGDAVAKGMLRASGDIIAWINSDDVYADNGVFAAIAEAFRSAAKPDIVYGLGDYVGRGGEVLRPAHVIRNTSELDWRLPREVGILQPATFISKDLVDLIGPVSRDYHFCLDYEFWVRAHQAGARFMFLDKPLAKARYYSDNKTLGQRGESLQEVIGMVRAKFGFAHIEWIKRFADFRLNGNDGILRNFGNQPVDKAQLQATTRDLNIMINGDFDTAMRLTTQPPTEASRTTVEMLAASADQLPMSYAEPVATDAPVLSDSMYYSVGPRRWAFKRHWLAPQMRSAFAAIEKLAGERASDTCVLAGNGPSLNQTDLKMLEGQDVYITNFAILNPSLRRMAKYLSVTNFLVAEQGAHAFNTLQGVHKILPFWLSYCLLPSPQTHYLRSVGFPKFETDFRENVSWRSTVSFFAMQIAYALGYRKLVLVGFDNAYVQPAGLKEGAVIQQDADDQNHFDPRYFKGRQWQAADTGAMEAMYALARTAFEADGREIVNCTVGGKLEIFRRSTLELELPARAIVAAVPSRLEEISRRLAEIQASLR